MSFLKPKKPQVVTQQSPTVAAAPTVAPPPTPAAAPAQTAAAPAAQDAAAPPGLKADFGTDASTNMAKQPGSLIATTPQGLTRKAFTRKPSLIGGGGYAN